MVVDGFINCSVLLFSLTHIEVQQCRTKYFSSIPHFENCVRNIVQLFV